MLFLNVLLVQFVCIYGSCLLNKIECSRKFHTFILRNKRNCNLKNGISNEFNFFSDHYENCRNTRASIAKCAFINSPATIIGIAGVRHINKCLLHAESGDLALEPNADETAQDINSNVTNADGPKPRRRGKKTETKATMKVHAPRPVTKKMLARHKIKPIPQKIQGVAEKKGNTSKLTFSSNLRIAGGALRGRKLFTPNVYLRPMMAKVKLALFSSLQFLGLFAYGHSCNVIDLFCGSGSVGIEALSFGADKCTFVDLSLDCCKATAMNLERCGLKDQCRVVRADAIEAITSPWLYSMNEKFDLMFVTPPYEEVVYMDLMEKIAATTILNENAIVVVEYPKEINYLPQVRFSMYLPTSRILAMAHYMDYVIENTVERW
ncbi:S-adenosyl-L-methionine-dependent methyltransferase superfamily [Babesia duncani]|uniref:S-adenosyl-L-methionine-dependent methyltransferase superfamily n=1 Tax=Babesia duncani TaxID=323732 RepID=A0AAD9PHT1_9APIC|nr:S-adenosyl-L-methionine-dependent methyltransferase superfamily [Babesia duncani]